MVNAWRTISGVAELCLTPKSIFSPIPYFAIFLFLLSLKTPFNLSQLWLLAYGILLTLLAVSASNIWNHVNDLKEDLAAGKKTLLTQNQIPREPVIILSVILYAASSLLALYLSRLLQRPIYLPFLLWAALTWIYSDGMFAIHITRTRPKAHYLGELGTYIIAYPSFTLSIWLVYSNSLAQGAALATAFLFFGLSGVLLKDLKDISGDREAGLQTFGVMFAPSTLLRASCILLTLYYLTIITAATAALFNYGTLIVLLPFAYYMKGSFLHFARKHWVLSEDDYPAIRIMMTTTYASLLFFGAGNLLQII
jgi:1,4-dihydroxy-2-naphthoate octaprenyltransferase